MPDCSARHAPKNHLCSMLYLPGVHIGQVGIPLSWPVLPEKYTKENPT